ncbi:MAG: hypothetical protein AABX04_03925, partial [Nanoarchaeota archaeon]
VLGCTDSKATNYNPLATKDDGSCTYAPADVLGCTDSKATNYNPLATKDDDSCTYRLGLEIMKAQPTSEVVSAGGSTLFMVKVRNNGDLTLSSLQMKVMIYDWGVLVPGNSFSLKPGQSKTLTSNIEVPSDIASGDYLAEVIISNDQIHEVAYRQLVVN